MEQYHVSGMSCAACSARVEKAVSKVEGVTSCSVSLLTNSMGVEGTASEAAIIQAVEEAGYGASRKGAEKSRSIEGEEALADTETPVLKRRLAASLGFLLVLMYFSMGHTMWGFPLPDFFIGNPVAIGLVQLLLAGIVMIINQKFFISGCKSLLHRAPNMDTLVALGSGASFVYSTYALFQMTEAQSHGKLEQAMGFLHEFYFESAAMILTLITVGKMLEARSKGRTTDALKGLMNLAPKSASVLRNGVEIQVPVGEVLKGDVFLVRPGESIPVDGVILEGNSAINEAALTGESIPADKQAGDSVYTATLNQSGFLKCQAEKVGEDTSLSQIIRMVSDAAATKAPIAKIADKVSGVFVPAVIVIALATIAVWLFAGQSLGFALARGISVLVISCPCALGLATPVAIMVGNGVGAKNGVLFKTAVSLEETGKMEVVVLDKTGTLTQGTPKVTDVMPAHGMTEEDLLQLAYALEKKSEHPLAKAVVEYAEEKKVSLLVTEQFQAMPGNGLKAVRDGITYMGGNRKLIESCVQVSKTVWSKAEQLSKQGKTPLFFSKGAEFAGIIAVADVLKKDSCQAVRELQGMGIRVLMLTGDNKRTAQAIGELAGVDEVIAEVLPDGKEAVIRSLKESGKVAMVGDGINDAPALTRADIGIAIGTGTDVAVDAADVVIMKNRLRDVPAAIRLSRAALRNIHENLFWAFFYNVIGIPLAAGVWIPLFHWQLNPMFGAAAMSLSSFCVVSNALRLNFIKIYDASKDKKCAQKTKKYGMIEQDPGKQDVLEENSFKEEDNMEKTMNIEGMMCGHCEATVKKALEALPQVTEAVVSHTAGTAVLTLNGEIADDVLIKAVEDKDYKVAGIEG